MAERAPLLSEPGYCTQSRVHDVYDRDDVYDRFTPAQKRLITSVIATAGLLQYLIADCFTPLVPTTAKDLNTTGVAVNYIIGIFNAMTAAGMLIVAPCASFYGRRPVYLFSLPLTVIGALVSAGSRNVFELATGRSVQAFGISCVLPIGATIISDVYRLEERGTAMGVFFGMSLIGPLIAPVLAGWLATYASWRMVHLCLAMMGLICFAMVILFLPETSHPGTKGIDKLRMAGSQGESATVQNNWTHWKFISLDPLQTLLLLKNPVLLFVSLFLSLALMAYFVATVPLPYTLGPQYGMDSPTSIGLCFLPPALGDIVGSLTAGPLADIAVIRGRRRRQGKWMPEDRLLAAIPGFLFFIPCALITLALSITFIHGRIGLTISLVCLFFNSMGGEVIRGPCSTYLLDIFDTRGAEAIAVSMTVKYVFGAIASGAVLPMINQFGIIATNTTMAGLAWLTCILLYITIKNGDNLRVWAGMDYNAVQVMP